MLELLNRRAVRAAAVLAVLGSTPAFGQPPDDLTLEPVAGGFDFPLAIRNAGDGSGRLFVVEQGGVIWIVDGGVVSLVPFLDISDRDSSSSLIFTDGFESGDVTSWSSSMP